MTTQGGRCWPAPRRPWLMTQTWRDLLFAHWPVPADRLRELVPRELEVDVLDGTAWVGVVPFTITGIRFHWAPPLPGISAFHELNVRTYVTIDGKPGVWFLSLDAASRFNVWAARKFYYLPYYFARITLRRHDETIDYISVRRDCHGPEALLETRYGADGKSAPAGAGTIEEWLTERYCLYSADDRGRIWRAEIDHPPWQLQPAWAEWRKNSMARAGGVSLPDTSPLLHLARRQETRVWGLERVR